MSLKITNAKMVLPDELVEGSLSVKDGVFSNIGEQSTNDVDFEGDYLIPGLIDIHTDNLEKHFFPRPGIDWDPRSAALIHDAQCASAGVTTVFDSISVGSWSGKEARQLDNLLRLTNGLLEVMKVGALKVDHKIHWRCETTNPYLKQLLGDVIDHPLTGLLSVMDHTPGQRQYPDLEKHKERWREHLNLSEEEIDLKLKEILENQANYAPENRSHVCEVAKAMNISLASHDDQKVEHVNEANEMGVTIAEFPTTLEAAQRSKELNMHVVMGGPNLVRGGSYSGNASAFEVAKAGLLDVFASDYVPRSMIEAAFNLHTGELGWSLPDAIKTVTANAAKCVGLNDRGSVEVGKRGDFVRVELIHNYPIVKGVWVRGQRIC